MMFGNLCMGLFNKSRIGEGNPNWKGGSYPKGCLGCGVTFTPKDHPDRAKYCSKRCSKIGTNNPQWKEDVGYSALHNWVYRHLEKPNNCACCGKPANLDLANISKEYKRELTDWEWLCRSCHMIKDGVTKRLIEYGLSSRKYGEINCKECDKAFMKKYKKSLFCCKPCSTTYYNKHIRIYTKKNDPFSEPNK